MTVVSGEFSSWTMKPSHLSLLSASALALAISFPAAFLSARSCSRPTVCRIRASKDLRFTRSSSFAMIRAPLAGASALRAITVKPSLTVVSSPGRAAIQARRALAGRLGPVDLKTTLSTTSDTADFGQLAIAQTKRMSSSSCGGDSTRSPKAFGSATMSGNISNFSFQRRLRWLRASW